MKKLSTILCTLALLFGVVGGVNATTPTDDELNAALAAITDGGIYRVTTTVNRTTYYLTTSGTLSANRSNGGLFAFTKVKVDGTKYEYGWNLGCNFTNPEVDGWGSNVIKPLGVIRTGNDNRDSWERQVFFKNNEGKYAVRATNTNDNEGWAANSYWDVIPGVQPYAEYSYDPAYVWELKQVDCSETKTPKLLLKNGAINTADFDITPTGTSTLTTDNLYSATFTSKGGYCNTFKFENLDVSAYDKAVIKYTIAEGNGDWQINLPSGSFTALSIGSDQTYEIDLSGVDTYGDFTVFSWNHTGKSITISEVYLYKYELNDDSPVLEFDEYGKATTDKKYLKATGGLSYNAETGGLTSDGTAGTLELEFDYPVDLKNLIYFNVKRNGNNDIVNRLCLYDENGELINTWNSIKWDNTWGTGLDNNATNAFLTHNPVKKLVWQSDAEAAKEGTTITINVIEWTLKTISCAKAGETQLKTLPWININTGNAETPDWNMNGSSDTYYGNYSGDPDHYVDITDYEELRVYCKDNNTGFRAFFIISDGSTTNIYNTSKATWNNEEKYYSLDLSKVADKWNGKIALKAMKAGQSWNGDPAEKNVTNIVVYKKPTVNVQYILSGSGMLLPEAVAALADASATCIDAMGVKGITTNSEAGRTLLTSANPNCLFLGSVGNGKLSNTKNVIDGDACANLELVDGKPFKAPAAFTATAAKFTKAVGDAAYATMVVPFAVASLPTGVKAYNLNAANGEVITTEEMTSLTADKPVMVKAAADTYEFTASNVAVAATPDDVVVNGLLRGVYATTSAAADASNYVMQKNGNDVNFYLVTGTDATVKPFRAYLTTAVPSARMLTFNLDEVTAIDAVNNSKKTSDGYYNLNGHRVAQPTKGLYIFNGKKLIVR